MHALTKSHISRLLILFIIFLLGACSSSSETPTLTPVEATQTSQTSEALTATPLLPTATVLTPPTETQVKQSLVTPTVTPIDSVQTGLLADVLSVAVSGAENAYQFSVEIRSPDTGCEQYADWWEVITEDGKLVYRRILAHSHVNEQPFKRSGGPVTIQEDTVVIVRAHMHLDGYGGTAFQGSVGDGFEAIQLEPDFAADLAESEPLPSGCGF